MPSKAQDAELSQAVFRAIQEGSYPEDEQIVAAELPSSALNSLSELLEQARADVKVSFCAPSNNISVADYVLRQALASSAD